MTKTARIIEARGRAQALRSFDGAPLGYAPFDFAQGRRDRQDGLRSGQAMIGPKAREDMRALWSAADEVADERMSH